MRYRIAVGPIAGRKTMMLHSPGAVSSETAPTKVLTAAPDNGQGARNVPNLGRRKELHIQRVTSVMVIRLKAGG